MELVSSSGSRLSESEESKFDSSEGGVIHVSVEHLCDVHLDFS